jgi:hypothetical protein
MSTNLGNSININNIEKKLIQKVNNDNDLSSNKAKTKLYNQEDLFNNPMVEKAKKNLSKETLENLKAYGEEMFSIDFETKGTSADDSTSEEVLAQLDMMLRSGLHPSDLNFEEKDFLKEYVGKKWYEKYGWMENDLYRINL